MLAAVSGFRRPWKPLRPPKAVLSDPGRCRRLDSPGDLVLQGPELRSILKRLLLTLELS